MSGGGAAARILIVNADDLGRTAGVNAGIFEAHRRGIVTSATLMVAYPAAAGAAREAPPRLGLGLHVALTGGGRPLLDPLRVPSLVDGEGRFPARPEGHGDPRPDEVRAEAGAQLERFRALAGRPPTHLDSHHHVHRLPAVGEALTELAREHDLPVRSASPALARRLRRAGVRTTDRFLDGFYGAGATVDGLLELLARLEPGTSELMCHPARLDAELAATSSYAAERQLELDALTDPRVVAEIARRDIRLADFAALGRDRKVAR